MSKLILNQSLKLLFAPRSSRFRPDPLPSTAVGVGQGSNEPKPMPRVRRALASSTETRRPDGVSQRLQVSVNQVEPSESVWACNLLTKDCWRAALRNEVAPGRPKVAGIVGASRFPR